MFESFVNDPFFGIFLTLFFYLIGLKLHQRWKLAIFTPLIFAIICVIIFLLVFNIPQTAYDNGGQFVSIWVTPATVCLAIKLEKNYQYLKENYIPILTGIISGVLLHTVLILALCLLLSFNGDLFATLYPKSITTAIAVGVSESLGGLESLTVAVVVFTGILGAVIGPGLFKMMKINDPVAQGIALGAGAHAMGTTKAIEMGEIQGAMSSLSIVVTGLTVVLVSPVAEILLNVFF
ncbi:LrgB family protein [Tetragenococcus koreensis]|uniref:Antiholin-like protein LrgB n=1 Tax=Tetragenococcus koreensis TaxID=290335 RepID=A0AAN4ZSP9_9ENTE|nr:LrgB family protein [Tetragenococcus koreensis]MCF1618219.1 LrgB family protein [Tetragenococcus koreensis]MCF1619338.1 LrgB family protein [Tetragenococcus koreensis]MCF1622966.1 LrgB family protein [Tetragenococcus koreensis]MCF1626909.1 LrgB family protein [Tetragenococcus koreensis]MCF1631637.1 LrgB family protein [Tetragenococcus koreensis]